MQYRNIEYQTPINSDDYNKAIAGANPPGRYSGFDTIIYPGSGAQFSLGHNQSGIVLTDTSGVNTNPFGYYITKHGVRIHEDSAIPNLILSGNVGNASDRIDLIVATHDFLLTPGGQAATYSIVQGPSGSYTIPALPNPTRQIILGYITIAAGATALQALTHLASPPTWPTLPYATYTTAQVPGHGGRPDLRADEYIKLRSRFDSSEGETARYVNNAGGGIYSSLKLPSGSNTVLHADNGGSSIGIKFIEKPLSGNSGITINFRGTPGTDDFAIVHNAASPSVPTGYAKVLIPPQLRTTGVSNVALPGLSFSPGDLVELTFINGDWVVTKFIPISNATTRDYVPKKPIYFLGTGVISNITTSGANLQLTAYETFNPWSDYFDCSGGWLRVKMPGTYRFKITVRSNSNGATGLTHILYAMDSNTDQNFDHQTGNFIFTGSTTPGAFVAGDSIKTFEVYHKKTTTTTDNFNVWVRGLSNAAGIALGATSCIVEIEKIA